MCRVGCGGDGVGCSRGGQGRMWWGLGRDRVGRVGMGWGWVC